MLKNIQSKHSTITNTYNTITRHISQNIAQRYIPPKRSMSMRSGLTLAVLRGTFRSRYILQQQTFCAFWQ